jgi:hypothetical protein
MSEPASDGCHCPVILVLNMSYRKYFANGQKVLLKRVFVDEEREALDSITAYAMEGGDSYLDLSLPYGSDAADAYPFEEGMLFELLTDYNGIGLRLKASFHSRNSSKDVRLQFLDSLEFVSRRLHRRVDVNAWVGVERPAQGLAAMREAWRKNLQKLESGVSAAELTEFKKYPLNLSGGGLRLPLPEPAAMADLVLLFLSAGDKKGIICALAEVVWTAPPDLEGVTPTGLRFVNIKENDQARIDAVVGRLLEQLENL